MHFEWISNLKAPNSQNFEDKKQKQNKTKRNKQKEKTKLFFLSSKLFNVSIDEPIDVFTNRE